MEHVSDFSQFHWGLVYLDADIWPLTPSRGWRQKDCRQNRWLKTWVNEVFLPVFSHTLGENCVNTTTIIQHQNFSVTMNIDFLNFYRLHRNESHRNNIMMCNIHTHLRLCCYAAVLSYCHLTTTCLWKHSRWFSRTSGNKITDAGVLSFTPKQHQDVVPRRRHAVTMQSTSTHAQMDRWRVHSEKTRVSHY